MIYHIVYTNGDHDGDNDDAGDDDDNNDDICY